MACVVAGGCTRKDPSPADQHRWDVDDLAGDPDNVPRLGAILADQKEDEMVRGRAATALGDMPAGAAQSDALMTAIGDPSPIVRRDAVAACGHLGLTPSMAPIAGRLKDDPEVTVRRAAAVALGRLKGDAVIDPLLAALADRDAGVQMLAVEALQGITGQKFGREPEAWAKWSAGRGK
ncbi:MAG: HEAT repeat domain-containing protein [Planctomycetes bacterium]|nr:HEAT repeat domain-containing protein [Planctomycetota bacterium]